VSLCHRRSDRWGGRKEALSIPLDSTGNSFEINDSKVYSFPTWNETSVEKHIIVKVSVRGMIISSI
jgi:hypothetical protein